jgi:hypothetical protein
MTRFVGLDDSQKMTAICVVDNAGCRLWRGQCPSNPEQIGVDLAAVDYLANIKAILQNMGERTDHEAFGGNDPAVR